MQTGAYSTSSWRSGSHMAGSHMAGSPMAGSRMAADQSWATRRSQHPLLPICWSNLMIHLSTGLSLLIVPVKKHLAAPSGDWLHHKTIGYTTRQLATPQGN